MSSTRLQRGVSFPAMGTIVVLAAALCALWLSWQELCERGLIPWVPPRLDQAVTRIQMVEALVKRGRQGVPVLVEAFSDPDPKVRRSAILGLGRIGPEADEALETVAKALRDSDVGVRSNAIQAFVQISRDPQTVGRTIGKFLAAAENELRESAAAALYKIGADAVKPAIDALRSEPAEARMRALYILRRIRWDPLGSDPQRALAVHRSSIEPFLEDPDHDIRIEALMALAGSATPAQARELLQADYTSPDPQLGSYSDSAARRSVEAGLDAVARLGPRAVELLPDIQIAFENERDLESPLYAQGPRLTRICHSFFRALTAMGTAARPAAPWLLARFSELRDADSQIAFAHVLSRIGADPDQIVPIVVPLLSANTHAWNCYRAGKLLARVSPVEARRQVERLLPLVDGLLEDPETADAKMASHAIWGMAREAEAAVPALVRLVAGGDEGDVDIAAKTLAALGPAAAPAVPALLEHLAEVPVENETKLHGCTPIVRAFGRIGPASRPAVPRLLELLSAIRSIESGRREQDRWTLLGATRDELIIALGSIGVASAKVLAALDRELRDAVPRDAYDFMRGSRSLALRSLLQLTPESPAVLSECLGRLADAQQASQRVDLIIAIGQSQADRRRAVAPLIEALRDESPIVQAAAAMALGQMGSEAREATAALRQALADEQAAFVIDPFHWVGTSLWEPDGDAPLAPQSVAEAVRQALDRIAAEQR